MSDMALSLKRLTSKRVLRLHDTAKDSAATIIDDASSPLFALFGKLGQILVQVHTTPEGERFGSFPSGDADAVAVEVLLTRTLLILRALVRRSSVATLIP